MAAILAAAAAASGGGARSTKRIWRRGTREPLCARSFAEPITLSSTDPGDFRLPATALRICFVLPASRTRRREETREHVGEMQGPQATEKRLFPAICKRINFPHFHSNGSNLWITQQSGERGSWVPGSALRPRPGAGGGTGLACWGCGRTSRTPNSVGATPPHAAIPSAVTSIRVLMSGVSVSGTDPQTNAPDLSQLHGSRWGNGVAVALAEGRAGFAQARPSREAQRPSRRREAGALVRTRCRSTDRRTGATWRFRPAVAGKPRRVHAPRATWTRSR